MPLMQACFSSHTRLADPSGEGWEDRRPPVKTLLFLDCSQLGLLGAERMVWSQCSRLTGASGGQWRKGRESGEHRKGGLHIRSAAALSSKAGLSRPGSSGHTGRGAGVGFRSAGTVPKQSVSGGEVPGGSSPVDPVSPSICV